jgi:hypothetical protein
MSMNKQWSSWEEQDKSSALRRFAGAAFGAYLVASNLFLFTAPHLLHR